MEENKKWKHIVVYKPINGTPKLYPVDSYEIVDKGFTIVFWDSKMQEMKRLPYNLCHLEESK